MPTQEARFKSPRGKALITQSLYLLENSDEYKGILTIENYNKWYYMYIIRPDGTVEEMYDHMDGRLDEDEVWADHVIYPNRFHDVAKALGLVYDDETFARVCEMFVSDHLEDWGKLMYHLPKPNDVI